VSKSLNKTQQKEGVFVKTYGPKTPFRRYYFRCALDFLGVSQPIEYSSKYNRLKFESKTLELWKSHHLNVPDVVRVKDLELHLSVIKGKTLAEIFTESINFDIVDQLFSDINYRHQLAIKLNEPRLCHIDANLRNIMYSDNKIFHIDFEMGRESEPTNMWAQREITKLLISLSQVTDSMQNVLSLFFEIYTHVEIIEQFIDSKFGSKSRELIEKKLNKNGYTLINLAVEMNNYLVNSRNG
jgi:tRNA A-37 threonylcarbamoyl transferase component Bud32